MDSDTALGYFRIGMKNRFRQLVPKILVRLEANHVQAELTRRVRQWRLAR
jgi:hypothetical protein